MRRGTFLRRRNFAIRANAIGAAIAVLALALVSLTSSGPTSVTTVDDGERDGASTPTTASPDATATTVASLPSGSSGSEASEGAHHPAVAPAGDRGSAPPVPAPEFGTADEGDSRQGHYDHDHEHVGCVVVGGFPGSAGGNRDVASECWYVPDGDGGYVATGSGWTIEITRDGKRWTLHGHEEPLCQPVGFFKAGDDVIVRATNATTISVGKEHGC